jgi:hypothetical protein
VAQAIANVPRLLAPPESDWSHSAFTWDEDAGALLSIEIPADVRFRVGLRVADATALILDASGNELGTIPAHGRTFEELLAWLTRQIVDLTSSALPRPLAKAERTLPAPCVAGQTFDLEDRAALEELARYYANTHDLLQRVRSIAPAASPIRTWPHHMDMAIVIEVDPSEARDHPRSVSLGMEPGDNYYPEPYFYSSPHPMPEHEPATWPPLDRGVWHTDGFTGAVLLATDVTHAGDASAQQAALDGFARSAIAANQALLA